ncbi:MAG: hypothetical protein KDE26_02835 [Bacteroidetes bacterium]|nr:hypothetical protein [Bacteroidota bacterium]MCB0842182.1 hypothetical protein [Bacteroidota bacterium]
MKDPIFSQILETRETLDLHEPPPGHLERFERRLAKAPRVRKITPDWSRYLMGIAASVTIMLFIVGIKVQSSGPAEKQFVDKEIAELDTYYTSLYEEELSDLEKYDLESFEFARQLQNDLVQIEKSNQEFLELIESEGKNEYLVEAMIENYEMKLKILRKLKKLLRKVRKSDETSKSVQIS